MGNTYSRSSGDVSELKTGTLAITPFRFLDLPPELRLAIYPRILLTDEPLQWMGPYFTSDHATRSRLAGFLPKMLGAMKERPVATTRHLMSSYVATTTTITTMKAALLFTCKTIYREATELFYRDNIFVLRATTIGFQPILRHQPLLLLVQRLCIQYKGNDEPSTSTVSDYIHLVDAITSSCLQDIVDSCPNLRSLTVCGIPDSMQAAYYAWLHSPRVLSPETEDSFH